MGASSGGSVGMVRWLREERLRGEGTRERPRKPKGKRLGEVAVSFKD